MESDPYPSRYRRYVDLCVKINNEREDFIMRNRVVSVFFRKGKPILVSLNKRKTHPRIHKDHYSPYTCTIHSELAGVITLHNLRTRADSVLVVRGDGTYASQPCEVCRAVLVGAGIRQCWAVL